MNETRRKYNPYLKTIAMNILGNTEDCEECLSDTYLAAWNQIPPDRPTSLSAYLGRIVRCISIDYFRKSRAKKRYRGLTMLLSELEECMPEIPDMAVASSDDKVITKIKRGFYELTDYIISDEVINTIVSFLHYKVNFSINLL